MFIYQQLFTFTIVCIPQLPERLLRFYSPTGAPILWIVLGVSVALSALVVGIIVYRKRAKRNERYLRKCYCLYECFVL